MPFDISVNVPALAVFFQGLISFFSPCVLPLLPVYLGYLAGGMGENRSRKKLLVNTFFFVLGISGAFFLLGLGMTAIGRFFSQYQAMFVRVGGIIVVLFGLHQLGFLRFGSLEREHRVNIDVTKVAMNPISALVLGFTFSFAWSPCVGPALAGVLLMASSAATMGKGLVLIGVYTLGFVLPFMAVGLFADSLMAVLNRHRNVMKYAVKAGGILLILIGVMMVTGWMNSFSSYITETTQPPAAEQSQTETEPGGETDPAPEGTETPDTPDDTQEPEKVAAPDFTLVDQFGETHTMSDYKGKTVFLNFWATWCGPCRMEMPDIQSLYEDWDKNRGDLVVLGVAAPNIGREGSVEHITDFLSEEGYTYPTLMDEGGVLTGTYGISAFPTTWMIDSDGNVYGYVQGSFTREVFDDIVQQTMDSTK